MDDQLNSAFWKATLFGVLRNLLAGVSGLLITKGYLSGDQVTPMIAGLAGLIVALVTSILHKQRVQKLITVALDSPAGTSYEQVKTNAGQ